MTSRFEDHNKINIIEDIEKNLENTVNDITLADILQLLTFINDNVKVGNQSFYKGLVGKKIY